MTFNLYYFIIDIGASGMGWINVELIFCTARGGLSGHPVPFCESIILLHIDAGLF